MKNIFIAMESKIYIYFHSVYCNDSGQKTLETRIIKYYAEFFIESLILSAIIAINSELVGFPLCA